MTKLARLLSRLWHDRRGNFAMMTALAAVPMVVATGGAVEFGMMYSARVRIQDAADGAALAAAKQYATDPDAAKLETLAKTYFASNTGTMFRTTATLVYDGMTWTEDHSRELKLHVDYTYDPVMLKILPTLYADLSGQTSRVDSAVHVSDTTVEVAMVLDTSGSMADAPSAGGSSKIVTLRKVARSAATKFFAAQGTGVDSPTKVGIVPFSGAVNIGAANYTAYWMDPKGLSPLHHENFDWTTYTDAGGNRLATKSLTDNGWYLTGSPSTRLTRQYVMNNMRTPTVVQDKTTCTYLGIKYPLCTWSGSDKTWEMKTLLGLSVCKQATAGNATTCHPYRITYSTAPLYTLKGCVEARSGVNGVNDATPDESKPETLFVPYMAMDEPDDDDNSFIADEYMEFPLGVFPIKGQGWIPEQRNMNKYLLRPTVRKSVSTNNRYSPNFICDSAPILPLSTDATLVDTTINNLQAVGATNVDEGVGWGWRVLSPSEPFAGSRAYTDDKNIKALILMTDGENTSYISGNDNKSWYSSYGFAQQSTSSTNEFGQSIATTPKSGRIFEQSGQTVNHANATYTLAMDGRTSKVCTNAKADGKSVMTDVNGAQLSDSTGLVQKDGIQIYTIAFDIPAASKTRVDALLSGCASYRTDDLRNTALPYASKRKNFYSAKNEAELDAAFTDITASLSKLRVSH